MKQTGTVGFTGIEITVITLACIGAVKVAEVSWALTKLAYRSFKARRCAGKSVRDIATDEVAAVKAKLQAMLQKQEQASAEQTSAAAPAQA